MGMWEKQCCYWQHIYNGFMDRTSHKVQPPIVMSLITRLCTKALKTRTCNISKITSSAYTVQRMQTGKGGLVEVQVRIVMSY